MTLLFRYVKEHKGVLFLALFLAAINQVFSLLDPQIFRMIIDDYAMKVREMPSEVFVRGVLLLLLASVGVSLVSRVAKSFQDYYVNVMTQRVGTKMYADSVRYSFALPYSVFEDQRSGEILRKLEKARTDSQALIQSSVNVIFLSLISMVFALAYAFIVHFAIGITLTLSIPFLGVTTFLTSRRIKAAQKRIVMESAGLAGATTETLRNVELVKSLGLENQEANRLNAVNEKILGLELKKVRLIRTLVFIQGTLVNLTRAAMLFVMLYLIAKGSVTLGEFFSLMFYSFAVFTPLYELGTVASQYQEARASLEALREVLSMKIEPKPERPQEAGALQSIEFDKVDFAYGGAEAASLHKVTLAIKSGTTVALVGPSGAGKSTLVKLILGLYRPTGGKMLINGVFFEELDRDSFRKRIGYVSQETQLFAGTVRENLLFVNAQATDADCLDALSLASATAIIERGGKGLDTRIGEGGIKISGGERQRLAIARALLRKPELIVFDEATSSLDSITEHAITETIRDISKSRPNLTSVIIAHRLSTVAHADQIYVFEKGEVVEQGNHEALLKKKGLYAALWREQGGKM